MLLLIKLQIKLTCWTIVSLAGGGLGKVEEGERQGEKEKNHLKSHPQKNPIWDEKDYEGQGGHRSHPWETHSL